MQLIKVVKNSPTDEENTENHIFSLGTKLFRDGLLLQTKGQKIMQSVIDDVLFIMQHQRQSFLDKKPLDLSQLSLIKDIIQLLTTNQVYRNLFEVKFIEKA